MFLLQNLQATFSISLHLPGEMSKEGGVVAGLRRKSARILALEEEKQKQKLNFSSIANNNSINKASPSRNGSFECQQQQHHGVALTSTTMPLTLLKRGRKQKRLEDLVLSSLAQNPSQQSGENSKEGNTSTGHGQQANGLPSTQWVPEKGILELVLDMLQRRDTHKIFAQPVNPIEVENYYTIIKEPMDFGTMRSKLQEGKYTSLEQFEHDVFLISTNAMHFNSSATIYYKEARGMQELAQMVFRALRTDPYKLKSQLIALTRSGRPGRRPIISEIRGQRTRLPRLSGVKIGASPLGRNSSTLSKRGRPPMNRPWTPFSSQYESLVSSVFNACKILVQNNDNGDFGYKESLLRFVKNLGPTARKVAARKLIQCLPYYQAASSSRQTPIFNPQRTTQRFLLPSPILSFPSRLAYNFQTPNIASLVPNFPRNSNAIPSYGKYNTFNLNLQASPIDHESSGSSNGGTKIHEPRYDGGLKVNNLIMPPPKEKNPIDQDALRKMPFVLDNKMAENGGRDTQYPLKDKMVAETSDFNEKMGKFPWNFLRENVAGQLENNSITSSILDNNIAANRGRDAQFSLKGKIVAEANDFNEQMGNLSGKFLWEDVAGQREKNTQMPSIFDTKIAANRGSDAWFPLKEKMVAETSDFNEKMGNFPGNFLQENVPGQRENNSQMPFILYNNFASNGGRDAQFPFKGKMVAETSDSNEKMGNFPGNFLQENVSGQRGINNQMPFILDINIAANGIRDAQYPFKGKMVAETSDFKEKMRNFPGNFLQENIAGQLENNSQMPFILDNNITANGGRDNKYPLKGKMVAETSDFNEKMGNSPGNFLLENAAGEQENNSQNKFWLASHFRVIPVHDDDPNTPHASSKTRFRTVDMLAEGDKNNDNNALQKGKQIEVVHWPRVEQLSTNWKSRLQDFVHRSNDFKESSFLFPSLEEAIFPSSTAATTTSSLLGVLGRSDGPVGWQGPEMGPNYAGNYTQPLEGGSGFPSFQMLLNNEANSLNQLSYTTLRQDLQPPSSSGQLGVLMPLYNEASNILHGRVDDRDQQELPLKDSQLPDLALQL